MSGTYTVRDLTIEARIDSNGRLFMYLPVGTKEGNGQMVFGGNTFVESEFVLTLGHEGNFLVLSSDSLSGEGPTRGPLWFQTGANTLQGVHLYIEAMDALSLGLRDILNNPTINVIKESGYDIGAALDILDNALFIANRERSNLGAMENRLEFTMKNLAITSEYLSSAESRIRDADIALEMMQLTQANILQQAAITMLAQANQAPNTILELLKT